MRLADAVRRVFRRHRQELTDSPQNLTDEDAILAARPSSGPEHVESGIERELLSARLRSLHKWEKSEQERVVGRHPKGPIVERSRQVSFIDSEACDGEFTALVVVSGDQKGTFYGQRVFEDISLNRTLYLYQLRQDGELVRYKLYSHHESGGKEHVCGLVFSQSWVPRFVDIQDLRVDREQGRVEVAFSVSGEARCVGIDIN